MKTVWRIMGILIVAALIVGAGAFWMMRQSDTAEAEAPPPTASAATEGHLSGPPISTDEVEDIGRQPSRPVYSIPPARAIP